MLFEIDGNFVDVVHERPYEELLTIRASSAEALVRFKDMTLGEIVQVPHHIYTHIVHVPSPVLETQLSWKDLRFVEEVDRLTPEPAAFGYEYAHEEEDGKVRGDYGFCWPDEIESTKINLYEREYNLIGEPSFMCQALCLKPS